MSNPTSNFGWQMPTATDLVTDLPADFEVFGQAVDTDLADLNGGTTGQILSKTSATDLDFTWIDNDQGDITGVTAGTGISGGGTSGTVTVTNSMATAIDAKGDLIAGTGADAFSRLAVGANNTVLIADSLEATGLKYAASLQSTFTTSGDLIQATGNGTFARLGTGTSGQYLTTNGTTNSWGTISAGAFTSLATGNLSGTQTTISGISASYRNIYLIIVGAYVNSATPITLRVNSISSGYSQISATFDSGFGVLGSQTAIKPSGSNLPTTSNSRAVYMNIQNYATASVYKPITLNVNADQATGDSSTITFANVADSSAFDSINIRTVNGTSTFSGGTYTLLGEK
jgi:hypothetical protein